MVLHYIMSKGRPQPERQLTLAALQRAGLDPVLVLSEEETEDNLFEYLKLGTDTLLSPARHIGEKREFIRQHAGTNLHITFDDDLKFYRRVGNTGRTEKIAEDGPALAAMFAELHTLMQTTTIAGITERIMLHVMPLPVRRNRYPMFVYGINPALLPEGITWNMNCFEDLDFVIHSLSRGGGTGVLTSWAVDQHRNGRVSPGGAEGYRTPELRVAAAQELRRRWHRFEYVLPEHRQKPDKVCFRWSRIAKAGGLE